MSNKPIFFSGPMVLALLAGTKTQTRRYLTASCDEPPAFLKDGVITALDADGRPYRWPRTHAVGDRLYVREAHYLTDNGDYERAVYSADSEDVAEHLASIQRLEVSHPAIDWSRHRRLRPPMHMPLWASRLTLTVTDVRVQRLQDISEADAIAEGIVRLATYPMADSDLSDPLVGFSEEEAWSHDPKDQTSIYKLPGSAKSAYRRLWNSINGADSWRSNPWVAAYSFTVALGNIDTLASAP